MWVLDQYRPVDPLEPEKPRLKVLTQDA
jgi:hypothetical protein